MNLTETLEAAIAASDQPDTDQAGLQLMRIYAQTIEQADKYSRAKVLNDLGPKLLAALTAHGMTHAGRAVKENLKGGAANDSTDTAASTFAALRASFN